jgi:hypothetical protein
MIFQNPLGLLVVEQIVGSADSRENYKKWRWEVGILTAVAVPISGGRVVGFPRTNNR